LLVAGRPSTFAASPVAGQGCTSQNIVTKSLREHRLADLNLAWVDTARQALPEAFKLLGRLRPTVHMADLRSIDADFLDRHGIRAILWDVDGTLMGHHAHQVDPLFRDAFDRLRERDGLQHALLSNCDETRFLELGRVFPDLAVLRAYTTPGGRVCRRLQHGEDRWSDVTARGLDPSVRRKIAKPSEALIRCAREELGLSEPDRLLMVGDQYFTDIAGANLAGIRSVKVSTHRRDTFPPALRIFQRLEQLVYAVRYPGARS
jgi:HAD superfamily phosphatase (TIGR01668 family)